ncbi:MAG: DUF805 domain-containing protein [Maritimibacter sp.]|nr:DUF805 domain-containing protein [Maritimibacter sp.]
MGFVSAVGICFGKYTTFSGRAPRSEYWWWTLFLILGSVVHALVAQALLKPYLSADLATLSIPEIAQIVVVGWSFWLVTLLPTLAVTVRRLHDTGRTGAWIMAPWVLNGVGFWGAMIARPDEIRALGLTPIDGHPWIGGALMYGAALALLILSINMLIWMVKVGTRGDNFHGPDPRPGAGSYSDHYAEAYGTPVPDQAAAAAARQSHREEVSALYRQRVLGNRGEQA